MMKKINDREGETDDGGRSEGVGKRIGEGDG